MGRGHVSASPSAVSFHFKINRFQIFVERRAAIQNLIFACACREFVNRSVVVFKRFAVERDSSRSSLSSSDLQFLESFERFDWRLGIIQSLHVNLNNLGTVAFASVSNRNSDSYAALLVHRSGRQSVPARRGQANGILSGSPANMIFN